MPPHGNGMAHEVLEILRALRAVHDTRISTLARRDLLEQWHARATQAAERVRAAECGGVALDAVRATHDALCTAGAQKPTPPTKPSMLARALSVPRRLTLLVRAEPPPPPPPDLECEWRALAALVYLPRDTLRSLDARAALMLLRIEWLLFAACAAARSHALQH